MFNLNRRHTEAVEKSARTEKRLADAEETIAQHLGDFLRDTDILGESKTAPQTKSATPPKTKPLKK